MVSNVQHTIRLWSGGNLLAQHSKQITSALQNMLAKLLALLSLNVDPLIIRALVIGCNSREIKFLNETQIV